MQQPPHWQQQIQSGGGAPVVRPPTAQPSSFQAPAAWHSQQQLQSNFHSQFFSSSVRTAAGPPSAPFADQQLDSVPRCPLQNAETSLHTARLPSAASDLHLSHQSSPSFAQNGQIHIHATKLSVPPWAGGLSGKSDAGSQGMQVPVSQQQPSRNFCSSDKWRTQHPESHVPGLPPQRGSSFLQTSHDFERPICPPRASQPPSNYQTQQFSQRDAPVHAKLRPPLQVNSHSAAAAQQTKQQVYGTLHQSHCVPQEAPIIQSGQVPTLAPSFNSPPVYGPPRHADLQSQLMLNPVYGSVNLGLQSLRMQEMPSSMVRANSSCSVLHPQVKMETAPTGGAPLTHESSSVQTANPQSGGRGFAATSLNSGASVGGAASGSAASASLLPRSFADSSEQTCQPRGISTAFRGGIQTDVPVLPTFGERELSSASLQSQGQRAVYGVENNATVSDLHGQMQRNAISFRGKSASQQEAPSISVAPGGCRRELERPMQNQTQTHLAQQTETLPSMQRAAHSSTTLPVYASCRAICKAMLDLTALLLTEQDVPLQVSAMEELNRLGCGLEKLARKFFEDVSSEEFDDAPRQLPPPETCELVACVLNSLLVHLLAAGLLTSPEASLREWAVRTWGLVGVLAEAFYFSGKEKNNHSLNLTGSAAPGDVSTVFRNSCKTLRHISVVGLSHLCSDGFRGVRLAALEKVFLTLGGLDERMAALSLQREGFPPSCPNPFSLLEQQLRPVRIGLSGNILAAEAAAAAASSASSHGLVVDSNAHCNKAPTVLSVQRVEEARAAAGVSLMENLKNVNASLLSRAHMHLGVMSGMSVRDGFLLLSLDDASEEVRCAASRVLLKLLHSLRLRGGDYSRVVLILQSLLWDLMADASLSQQRVVAAACKELSLAAPLRDGALRRAVGPLLFERRIPTRQLLLDLIGQAAAFNARACKVAIQGVLLLLPSLPYPVVNSTLRSATTAAMNARRSSCAVALCIGLLARRYAPSARVEAFRVLSRPAKRALVRGVFPCNLGLRQSLLQFLAAAPPSSLQEGRVKLLLKRVRHWGDRACVVLQSAATVREGKLRAGTLLRSQPNVASPAHALSSLKRILHLQKESLAELVTLFLADEAAEVSWSSRALTALPLDLQLQLPMLALRFRSLHRLWPNVSLLLAASTAQTGLLSRAEHLRRGRSSSEKRNSLSSQRRVVAFPFLPVPARFAAPSRVADPVSFLQKKRVLNAETKTDASVATKSAVGNAEGGVGETSEWRNVFSVFKALCCCVRSSGMEECRCPDSCGCAESSWLSGKTTWKLLHLEVPCRISLILRTVPLALCLQRALHSQAAIVSDVRMVESDSSPFKGTLLQSLRLLRLVSSGASGQSWRNEKRQSSSSAGSSSSLGTSYSQRSEDDPSRRSLNPSFRNSGPPTTNELPSKRLRIEGSAEKQRFSFEELSSSSVGSGEGTAASSNAGWESLASQAARSAATLPKDGSLLECLDSAGVDTQQLLWQPSEADFCLTLAMLRLNFAVSEEGKQGASERLSVNAWNPTAFAPWMKRERWSKSQNQPPVTLQVRRCRVSTSNSADFDELEFGEDDAEGRRSSSGLRLDCRQPRLREIIRSLQPECVKRAGALVEGISALVAADEAQASCATGPSLQSSVSSSSRLGSDSNLSQGASTATNGQSVPFSSARTALHVRRLSSACSKLVEVSERLSKVARSSLHSDALLPVDLSRRRSQLQALSALAVLQSEHLPLPEGALLPYWQIFRFMTRENQRRGLEAVALAASLRTAPDFSCFFGNLPPSAQSGQSVPPASRPWRAAKRHAESDLFESFALTDLPFTVDLNHSDWSETVSREMQLSASSSSLEGAAFVASLENIAGAAVRLAGCGVLSLEANLLQRTLRELLPAPAVFLCSGGGGVLELNICISASADAVESFRREEKPLFVCLRVPPAVQLPAEPPRPVCTDGGTSSNRALSAQRSSSELRRAILCSNSFRSSALERRWTQRSSVASAKRVKRSSLGGEARLLFVAVDSEAWRRRSSSGLPLLPSTEDLCGDKQLCYSKKSKDETSREEADDRREWQATLTVSLSVEAASTAAMPRLSDIGTQTLDTSYLHAAAVSFCSSSERGEAARNQ